MNTLMWESWPHMDIWQNTEMTGPVNVEMTVFVLSVVTVKSPGIGLLFVLLINTTSLSPPCRHIIWRSFTCEVRRICLIPLHVCTFKRIVCWSGKISWDQGYNEKVKCKSCQAFQWFIKGNHYLSPTHWYRVTSMARVTIWDAHREGQWKATVWLNWRKPGINFWSTALISFRLEPWSP